VEAEAHFEERSWKRKQTRKHILTFCGAGSGSIFHKTWLGMWKQKRWNFKFLWKRKHFEERS